jgi:hypothetical protein
MNKPIRDPQNWMKDELALLWGLVLVAALFTVATPYASLAVLLLGLGALRTSQIVVAARRAYANALP